LVKKAHGILRVKCGKDGHMKANCKVKKNKCEDMDSKENVSNVEREVIWLMIVKERRMERRTKSLINLN
jgi:hypothetical protein